MARDDDEVDEGTSFDPTFATAGPRRSTFTPPPGSPAAASASTGQVPSVDDDELANALAADLGRIASGPITVPPVTAPPIDADDDSTDEAHSVTEESLRAATPAAPTFSPDTDSTVPVAVPADLEFAPPPVPGSAVSGDVPPPPAPWSSLPAPDPTQAVELPGEGPLRAPVRRSLSSAELLSLAEGEDAGSRIDQLQEQLQLREQEARDFSVWEARMLALGTPDAFQAVRDARAEFHDLVGVPVTGAVPVSPGPSTPGAAASVPSAEPSAPAIVPEPAAPEQVIAEPAAPEQLVAEPAVSEPVVEPVAPEPVVVVPPPLPAWDVPPPSPGWSPGPDLDDDAPASPSSVEEGIDESGAANEPVAVDTVPPVVGDEGAPQTVWSLDGAGNDDAESASDEPLSAGLESDEPAPDSSSAASVADEDDVPESTESPFAPPPLVEPPPFGGPPLLPSQAAHTPPPLIDAVPAFEVGGEAPSDLPLFQPPTEPGPAEAASDSAADLAAAEIITAEVIDSDEPVDAPAPPAQPVGGFSFDDLIAGSADMDDEPAHPEPETSTALPVESLFIEPLPVAAGEAVPTETGSVAIVEPAYEEDADADEVVDGTDRVGIVGALPFDALLAPPSGPIATIRVADDEVVLLDNQPVAARAFSVEESGPEPTPLDRRVGHAARLFWLWFASNASVISLGLGATVFAIGMSLRQSIVAVLAGVALSFIPLGLTTLAGKRSGQPTMIVSRASFGHRGNIVPAIIAVVSRVFWGGVMLWLAASAITVVLVGAELDGGLGEGLLLIVSLVALFAVALAIAVLGYWLFARVQLVLSVLSTVLVVGFIAFTAEYIDVPAALTIGDASWLRAIAGAVLVFSVVGLVWANSGADLARYQRPESSGGGSMLWATFGAGLPAFLLIGYGALLAASNSGIASGFLQSPLDTLALMLPSWYPVPLIAATVLSLLSGVVITMYSGAFAVQAVGIRVPRPAAVVIVAVLLAGLAGIVGFAVPGGVGSIFRDVATTLAVPTAAWAGIVAAEVMIRNRRFESGSLVNRGGVYSDWRWANLIGLVVITALGFGLTTADASWLTWQGYVFDFFGVPLDSDLAATDLGVLLALGLGILLPIVVGIPAIRRQEETRL